MKLYYFFSKHRLKKFCCIQMNNQLIQAKGEKAFFLYYPVSFTWGIRFLWWSLWWLLSPAVWGHVTLYVYVTNTNISGEGFFCMSLFKDGLVSWIGDLLFISCFYISDTLNLVTIKGKQTSYLRWVIRKGLMTTLVVLAPRSRRRFFQHILINWQIMVTVFINITLPQGNLYW